MVYQQSRNYVWYSRIKLLASRFPMISFTSQMSIDETRRLTVDADLSGYRHPWNRLILDGT